MGFVLGCENWERYDFKALLRLVKSVILLIWDTRKNKLYGNQDGNGEISGCSCSCPLTGDLSSLACVCGGWSSYSSNMSILLMYCSRNNMIPVTGILTGTYYLLLLQEIP